MRACIHTILNNTYMIIYIHKRSYVHAFTLLLNLYTQFITCVVKLNLTRTLSYTHTHAHIHTRTYMCVSIYTYICVYTYVYVHIYMYIYSCMWIYLDI